MSLNFAVNATQLKNDELKRRLLDCIGNETNDFLKVAEEFYAHEPRDQKNYLQFCQVIVDVVDKVLASGNYNDSLFLHNTVKPLKQIREEATTLLEQLKQTKNNKLLEIPEVAENVERLYISIFQSDGHSVRKWELQLRSIASYLMGRPVYRNEEDIKRAIRLKVVQVSEAYIIVGVKKSDIQSDDRQPMRRDRNGSPLVTLKSGVVTPDNILAFVHQGKSYYYLKGKLIEKSEN